MLGNKRKILYYVGIALFVVIAGSVYFFSFFKSQESVKKTKQEVEAVRTEESIQTVEEKSVFKESEPTELIKVHIVGAVVYAGVYDVPVGSRIIDVLEMAGGASDDADLERVNLADYVEDAEQVYIPRVGQPLDTLAKDTETEPKSTLININTASVTELDSLPGIGEVIAQNIVRYRETNGLFNTKEDIKNVNRIGDKMYEQIADLITVD